MPRAASRLRTAGGYLGSPACGPLLGWRSRPSTECGYRRNGRWWTVLPRKRNVPHRRAVRRRSRRLWWPRKGGLGPVDLPSCPGSSPQHLLDRVPSVQRPCRHAAPARRAAPPRPGVPSGEAFSGLRRAHWASSAEARCRRISRSATCVLTSREAVLSLAKAASRAASLRQSRRGAHAGAPRRSAIALHWPAPHRRPHIVGRPQRVLPPPAEPLCNRS